MPPSAAFKICWGECGLELGEPRLQWQGTDQLRRQGLGSRKGLNNRKASHVATGSHQGHFTCWAKIQCSHNSNILMYSHFLNTKSFLLPTFQLFWNKVYLTTNVKINLGGKWKRRICGAIVAAFNHVNLVMGGRKDGTYNSWMVCFKHT